MSTTLPSDPAVFMRWDWTHLEPYADDLANRPLTYTSLESWMTEWSDLNRVISEIYARLLVAITLDTADPASSQAFNTFLEGTFNPFQAANQSLKRKFLDSGLQPDGCEIAIRNMQVETEIYRQENLQLQTDEKKLVNAYDALIGAETVEWEGQEVTPTQLQPVYMNPDRGLREKAWCMCMDRKLADRQRLNELWVTLFHLRNQIAANAGFENYRDYRWKELLRFEYTTEDCLQFHQAIEQVVVPAASRIYERRRKRLDLTSLRPWDLNVDPLGRAALNPYHTVAELEEKVSSIFDQVDPQLKEYYEVMRRNGLLDLENRKGKAPGAYCSSYDMSRLPFIFENAVGLHADVSTLLHEAGHAAHVFETAHLPYHQQLRIGMEFAEVASMAMELLASPYLLASKGGFYSEKEAARALVEHLEEAVLFWPYMAVVDAFQHWAYTHPSAATDPDHCDQHWAALWQRFMPGVDWGGLGDSMVTGWQRKQHIYEEPFYYIEYGLASLGAFQVWRNALKDQQAAVAAYRRALALGGTVTIPELYATAGGRFAMDAEILHEVISLAEEQIDRLERM